MSLGTRAFILATMWQRERAGLGGAYNYLELAGLALTIVVAIRAHVRFGRPLPRAFVPPRITYGRTGPQVLGQMYGATEFASDAFIEVAEYEPHVRDNGPGVVHTREVPNGLRIDTTMSRDGWVVVSQTAWKGWRAYIDGRRVQWRYANHAFLGVWVPAGHHDVRLVYLPDSFVRGRAISLGTIALLGIGLFVRRWRR